MPTSQKEAPGREAQASSEHAMEIRMSAEELQKGLYRAQGIVDRKATMPILANVLLEADEETIRVAATDLELGLRGEHPAQVVRPGRITLPARHLLDIVRNLPEPSVTISRQSNNYVEITSGKARFRIVGQAPEDFPAQPEVEDIPFVEVKPELLAEMLEKVQYAVSTDETRYNLNGVYVEQEDGITRMVATDGHRLSLVERELGGDLKLSRGVIVPRKGLAEMRRLLSEKPASVSIGFTGSNAAFRTEGLVLVMRLIDGQFPDYQQVVPAAGERPVVVDRDVLLGTLKRISLVSADRAPAVKLSLSSGLLTVLSENPDLGEAHEELEVDYDGPEITVGFNARYLIDVLGVLGCDKVRLEINDELSPAMLRPADEEGYTAVVMPMRI